MSSKTLTSSSPLSAYGVVYRARARARARSPSSDIVALKQIRITPEERQNGIPITALREISLLRSLKHENVVDVMDVAVGTGVAALDEIYMVMEYCEQVSPISNSVPVRPFFPLSGGGGVRVRRWGKRGKSEEQGRILAG